MKLRLALAVSMALAGPAFAQDADLSKGRFVMFENHWSDEANAFVSGPPTGSETACFAVGATTPEGVEMRLVAGTHFLTWSGETVTDFDTTWFSSERFLDDHPDADLLDELRILFHNVEGCGADVLG